MLHGLVGSIGRGRVIQWRIFSPVSVRILWSRLSQQIVHPHLRHQKCITERYVHVLFGEGMAPCKLFSMPKVVKMSETPSIFLGGDECHGRAATTGQPRRHVTGTAVLGARNTDWSRHSSFNGRTSRTRVRSVGCMRCYLFVVLGC